MKKSIFFCIVLMVMAMQVTYAQGVGINATGAAPDSSAMLDIAATNRGFLLPRFNLATAIFTPARPQSYLMVFDTVGTINAGSRFNTGRGLYFNVGTPASPSWRRFLTSADSTMFWGLRGNAGTNPADDYIGTSDGTDLSIRVAQPSPVIPTRGNSERILIPTRADRDIVVQNVRALQLPAGSAGLPSLRFTSTANSGGIWGIGINTVVVEATSSARYFFTPSGLSITSSVATATPLTSRLDVDGNIFTRGKFVYNEFANASQQTFLNEIHWNGTITSGNDSPQLLTEGTTLTIVVRRTGADEYFLRIGTSTLRTFTCIDQASGQIVSVNPPGPTIGVGNRVPVNFTNDIPAGNGVRTIFIKEPAVPNVTYQVTLLVLNNVTTVMIKRFQN
jgi:hypothetical protein